MGIVIDDIPLGRAQLGNVDFFDLERVEVLRGPQGMLFGKNAAAGVVNIVTATPKLNETEFLAHVQYGYLNTPSDGNQWQLKLGGNVPIGSTAALRIDGSLTRDPAYIDNVLHVSQQNLDLETASIRAKLRWEPTDSISVLLAADYAVGSGQGESAYTMRSVSPISCNPFATGCGVVPGVPFSPGWALTTLGAYGVHPSADNVHSAQGDPNNDNYNLGGVSLKTSFDLGGGYTLTNIMGYRKDVTHDARGVPIPTVGISPDFTRMSFEQETEELRLTSPAGQRLTFQAGLFYLHLLTSSSSDASTNYTLPFPPPLVGTGFNLSFNERTQSLAGFFEGQYKLMDKLRLTGGLRYTADDLHYRARWINSPVQTFPCPFDPTTAPGQVCFDRPNSAKHYDLSYRFSLDYDIVPDTMAYFSFSKGYKGPTFDQISAAVVGPEIPRNYEVGLKSTTFDGRLRTNLALFHTVFDGFQTQVTTFAGTQVVVLTVNAGQLKAQGVELEFTALPFEGLTVSGGVTYNNTKFSGLPLVPCYAAQPAGSGRNQCNTALGGQNVNGDSLQQAPEWTEAVTVRYERPVWDQWDGFVQTDAHIQSPVNFQVGTNPSTRLGTEALLGLSAGAKTHDGRTTVTLFVRNLLDNRIPTTIGPANDSAFGDSLFGAHGDYQQSFSSTSFRTIGVSLDYRM